MKFEEAIVALKQGKRVRRMAWANIDSNIKFISLEMDNNCLPINYWFSVWTNNSSSNGKHTFELPVEDIFADDWEIYDPKTDKEKASYLEGWRNGYEQARQESKSVYKYIDEKFNEIDKKITMLVSDKVKSE